MQGYVRNSVDFRASGDLQVTLSQRFDHLQTMYDNTVKLIDNYFQQPQLFSAAFDQLVQNQPSYPPSEKEARQLRGDPYFGRRTS
jgi:hypothetical protein